MVGWKIEGFEDVWTLLKMGIFHCHVSLLKGKPGQVRSVKFVGFEAPQAHHRLRCAAAFDMPISWCLGSQNQ